MSVLAVTGATGFIGRRLCEHFRAQGWQVRAMVRRPELHRFDGEGITMHRCELPEAIDEAALRGADALVHCAYTTRFTDRASAERVNDLGTRRLIATARAAGVKRLLFLSSQSAHEEAESYYGRSKLALERLFNGSDVVLRAGLVIGRSGSGLFARMCDVVRTARVIPLFGGGRQPVQTVHVEDLCRAVHGSLVKGVAGRYTVADPRPWSMGQLLREMAARLGRRPLFVPLPITPALVVLRSIERAGWSLPLSSENLLGLKCLRATDTTRDLAILGVALRTTRESLDETLGAAR